MARSVYCAGINAVKQIDRLAICHHPDASIGIKSHRQADISREVQFITEQCVPCCPIDINRHVREQCQQMI